MEIIKTLEFSAIHLLLMIFYQILKRNLIYVHWACCKIEKEAPDEILAYEISEALKGVKEVSYSQIANKAIDMGKKNLAMQLIENEVDNSKKVPLLLYIGEYEKALKYSIASKTNDLIQLVVMKIFKTQLPKEQIYKFVSIYPIARQYFLNYLKIKNESEYIEFIKYLKQFEDGIHWCIHQAYNQNSLNKRIEYLQISMALLEGIEKNQALFLRQQIQDQLEYYKQLEVKKLPTNMNDDDSVHSQLLNLIKEKSSQIAQFLKIHKISDRRYIIIKCNYLIQQANYDELNSFVKEKNKKPPYLIPYELLAQQLQNNQANDLAGVFAEKIIDVKVKIQILKELGKWEKACEVAWSKGMIKELEQIKAVCKKQGIAEFIEKLKKTNPPK